MTPTHPTLSVPLPHWTLPTLLLPSPPAAGLTFFRVLSVWG